MKKFLSTLIILSPISLYSQDRSLIIDNFYIKPLGGTEFNIGGSISQEATLAVGGNITQGGRAIANAAVTITAQEIDYDDAFDTMTSFGGEIGYNFSNDYFGFLRIMHNSADAQDFDAITAAANFTFGGQNTATVRGKFSDYSETSFIFGAGKSFDLSNGFHPYLSAGFGFATIDGLDLTLTAAGLSTSAIAYSKDSTVFATDLKTGVEYLTNVFESNQLSVGFDLGYRYKGGLESDETSINTTEASTLGSANDNIDGQHNFSIAGSLKLSF